MAWDREAWERGEGPSFGEYLGGGPDVVDRRALSRDEVREGVDERRRRRFKATRKPGGTIVTETTDLGGPTPGKQRKHVRVRL